MIQAAAPRPPARAGTLATFLEAIKFSHSVFALPFALVAMLAAARGWPGAWTFLWVIVACVAARTAAMCFNRLVDVDIDARNPRTSSRALVTGALRRDFMAGAMIASIVLFLIASGMLNWTCLVLAPWALVVLLGYSYTKRATHYSHIVLGLALGIAPIGGWVAVRGDVALAPVVLAIGVLLWVAGFDVLYSCQDYEVDRRDPGLHSIPKKLGLAGALGFARRLHAAAFVSFLLFWLLGPFGTWFLLGVLAAGFLMVRQHDMLRPTDLSRINAAFFNMNGMISVGLLLAAIFDLAAD